MSTQGFLMAYVASCTSGALRAADCGPVYQVLIIAVLLVIAIGTLVVMRLRAPKTVTGDR